MDVDNFKKFLDHILEEYPDLANFKPKIEKKFVASDGREYNTYLLSTTYPNFSKLVAKGVVNTSIDLNKERIFTKILADNKVNVPKLFYENKVPSKYLLLEYIEGEGLEDILDFGLLRGGRPFFDLGKFYLLILMEFPQYDRHFVRGYKKYIKLDENSPILLKFYIILEILGMMPFFNSIGNEKMLDKVLEGFNGLSSNKGVLNDLINNFK